jgi:Fe-S-cluster containining protein
MMLQWETLMPLEPWYKDGLRFQCTRCGHCCTGAPGYVWINDTELAAIAEYRREPLHEVRAAYTRAAMGERTLREKVNGDCVFFDAARGCTIYPVRPRQCRSWPFWESNLASEEDWHKAAEGCPGCGQGELISADEIAVKLKLIQI